VSDPRDSCRTSTRLICPTLRNKDAYGSEPADLASELEQLVALAQSHETIAELCRRLDHLPLAIELAAARTSVLSPAQILERLSDRLDLLKGGRDADPRQQTLRATIEWSHDLLDADEQRQFARLAVFRGGCTLETAQEVADADLDTLQSLVDKSLVRHRNERFWMLETVREYAWERLGGGGESEEFRRRHALNVLAIAEAAHYPMEEGRADQAESLGRIAAEHDNLRAALEWARDEGEDELLLRLAASLSNFWAARALAQEAETWLPLAYERTSTAPRARYSILRALTGTALGQRDFEAADAHLAERRSIAEREGNELLLIDVLNGEGRSAQDRGDLAAARDAFLAVREKAYSLGDLGDVAIGTVNLATIANEFGDFQAALDYSAEALSLFREVGDDGGIVVALLNIGLNAFALADHARAEESFREALVISVRVGFVRNILRSAVGLGVALVARREEETAACLFGAAAALQAEFGFNLDPELEDLLGRAGPDAKAALGEDAFAAAFARGEAMTPEEILTLADSE
jgi:Tetratricopeptide repeat